MTMFHLEPGEFDERTGDAIMLLDAYDLLDALRDMFARAGRGSAGGSARQRTRGLGGQGCLGFA